MDYCRTMNKTTRSELVHELQDESVKDVSEQSVKDMKKYIIAVYLVLVVMGTGTGYLLSGKTMGFSNGVNAPVIESDSSKKVYGVADKETFPDSAVGTLEKGGIDGEGTHKLIRPGGPSQTVYLLSSVVDLDEFVGKTVLVSGQTIQAQKAGWLMDVGRVEIE